MEPPCPYPPMRTILRGALVPSSATGGPPSFLPSYPLLPPLPPHPPVCFALLCLCGLINYAGSDRRTSYLTIGYVCVSALSQSSSLHHISRTGERVRINTIKNSLLKGEKLPHTLALSGRHLPLCETPIHGVCRCASFQWPSHICRHRAIVRSVVAF